MVLMILGIGFALLPLLLRLALKLRLGIPLVYSILMLTVFHGWYQAHAALADGILIAGQLIARQNQRLKAGFCFFLGVFLIQYRAERAIKF